MFEFRCAHQPCLIAGKAHETRIKRTRVHVVVRGGKGFVGRRGTAQVDAFGLDGHASHNATVWPVLVLGMDPMSSAIAAGVHPVDLARREMSFYADLFQKMTDSCFRKCVTRYHDAELQTGEGVCVDRCVFKYMGAVQRIGELLQEGQPAPPVGGPAASVPR